MRSVCVVELHVSVATWKQSVEQKCFYGSFMSSETITCTQILTWSSQYLCPSLNESVFSRQIVIKVPSAKFHGNLSTGSRADTYGQTDGHDEATRRFSRICGKPKNKFIVWYICSTFPIAGLKENTQTLRTKDAAVKALPQVSSSSAFKNSAHTLYLCVVYDSNK